MTDWLGKQREVRVGPTHAGEKSDLTWGGFLDHVEKAVPRSTSLLPKAASLLASALRWGVAARNRPQVNILTCGAALLGLCTRHDPMDEADTLSGGVSDEEIALIEGVLALALRIGDQEFLSADGATEEGQLQIRAHLVAMLSCQFSAQGSLFAESARSWFLIGRGQGMEDAVLHGRVESLITEAWSATPEGVLAGQSALAAKASRNSYLDVRALARDFHERSEFLTGLLALIDNLSIDATKVGAVVRDNLASCRSVEAMVFSIFQTYPVIRLGGPHCIVGPGAIVRGELGIGAILRLMGLDRDSGASKGQAGLPQMMGDRFEEYLFRVLAPTSTKHDIEREHEFHRKENWQSPDLVTFDKAKPKAQVATLLQLKIRRLSPETFFGHTPASLLQDVQDMLSGPIIQALKYLYRLSVSSDRGHLRDSTVHISQRVLDAPTLMLAGVFPSLPFSFATEPFRSMVWDSVLSSFQAWAGMSGTDAPNPADWWSGFSAARRIEWCILDATDLEAFASWRSKRRLGKTLVQFVQKYGKTGAVQGGGVLTGLPAYLESGGREVDPRDHPLLRTLFEERRRTALELPFGSGDTRAEDE